MTSPSARRRRPRPVGITSKVTRRAPCGAGLVSSGSALRIRIHPGRPVAPRGTVLECRLENVSPAPAACWRSSRCWHLLFLHCSLPCSRSRCGREARPRPPLPSEVGRPRRSCYSHRRLRCAVVVIALMDIVAAVTFIPWLRASAKTMVLIGLMPTGAVGAQDHSVADVSRTHAFVLAVSGIEQCYNIRS